MNRRIHNTPILVAPKLKGRTRNTNKLMNPVRFIFEASSIIHKVGQLVPNNIASWIMVSSRWVVGLSNGYLLFSARMIYRSMTPKRIIWIKNADVKYLPMIKACIDPISRAPVLKPRTARLNNNTGSTKSITNTSLLAPKPPK